jgi:hypothetical protein
MGPVILALGRSENHPILRAAANALGVTYLGVESGLIEARSEEVLASLHQMRSEQEIQRPVILTAIDSSISRSELEGFIGKSQELFSLPRIWHVEEVVEEVVQEVVQEFVEMSYESDQCIFLVTAARSEHGQVAIWPVIRIESDGSARPFIDGENDSSQESVLSGLIEEVTNEISQSLFVGVMNWYFSPQGKIIHREWGLAATTVWSESASITGVGEQFIRSLINLPLGDTRLIDFEDFYLESEIDLTTGPFAPYLATSDPTRPFLHLFARNPRLKVKYLDSKFSQAKISVSDPSHERALAELAHGERFMLGYDDE